ncbi:T9SS type A sorting domain-containing protein [Flavobacterium sp. P21]|uniref:T9SS type A sorting domain-containing protein n=1 Tax=Flavobacterium sp. P21 TaxID=3423948 RepID=UPI003D67CC52
MNIKFPNTENGTALINLFSSNGSKVYTTKKSVISDEKIELNLGNLAKGTYVCKIQIEDRSKTFKLVKN